MLRRFRAYPNKPTAETRFCTSTPMVMRFQSLSQQTNS
ncbi:hypothetical protein GP5015_48 [gamma proteobacterium HTCC5015]|nr:hypothetical protein GP5015_48 [gamma proteobacterium HTCC5015]